jgi:hypothetical protein
MTVDPSNPSGTHGTAVWSWAHGALTGQSFDVHGTAPTKDAHHLVTQHETQTRNASVSQTTKAGYEVVGVSALNAVSGFLSGSDAAACITYETITISVWAAGARVNAEPIDWEGCTP